MDSNPGTGATWIIFSHLYGLWLPEKTEKMATGKTIALKQFNFYLSLRVWHGKSETLRFYSWSQSDKENIHIKTLVCKHSDWQLQTC